MHVRTEAVLLSGQNECFRAKIRTVRHMKENLPAVLDVNSFQSRSLSILALFLEIDNFLLINKPICACMEFQPDLFIVTHVSNTA